MGLATFLVFIYIFFYLIFQIDILIKCLQISSLIHGDNDFFHCIKGRKLYAPLSHLLLAISFNDLGCPESEAYISLACIFNFCFPLIFFFKFDINCWQISSIITGENNFLLDEVFITAIVFRVCVCVFNESFLK